MGTSLRPQPLEADPTTVRQHADRILASPAFQGANRQKAFLRFVVNESLAGRAHELKETLIAAVVYEARDYDPRIDSTVRVEASKLRSRLQQYYEGAGAGDLLRLSIPKGSYHLLAEPVAPPQSAVPPPHIAEPPFDHTKHWRTAFLALLGILIVGGVAITLRPPGSAGLDPSRLRVQRLTEAASFSASPAISPAGDFTVYASDRDSGGVLNLWKQPLDGRTPVRLTRSAYHHDMPTISPDGSLVVFRTAEEGGRLAVIPTAGGETRLLHNSPGARHPRFSPRGNHLLYWSPRDEETSDYGRVFLASANADPGAGPVRLFGDFAHAAYPIWSDDGARVLAAGTWQSDVADKEYDAWVLDLDGLHAKGPPRKTGLFPALKASGHFRTLAERAQIELGEWREGWLYLTMPTGESIDLFRVRLSAEGRLSGAPQRLTFGVGHVRAPRIAAHGQIVFARSEISYDLFSLKTPARSEPAQDLRRHTSETGLSLRAAVHPAGKVGVWEKRRLGSEGQVWSFDLASGTRQKLGWGDEHVYSHAIVSPDGLLAAYRVFEPRRQPIYLQPVTGGPAKRICDNCGTPADWAPSGRHIFYITGGQPARIGVVDVDRGRNRDVITHPSYNLFGARIRMDAGGNGWAAFYADNGPQTRQIYLAPLRNFEATEQSEWIAITDGAHWDQAPAWSPDGSTLYYVRRHDGFACIMARPLDVSSGRPAGASWTVQHLHSPSQTLMRSSNNRGSDALWVAGQRLFFMLDNRASDLWTLGL